MNLNLSPKISTTFGDEPEHDCLMSNLVISLFGWGRKLVLRFTSSTVTYNFAILMMIRGKCCKNYFEVLQIFMLKDISNVLAITLWKNLSLLGCMPQSIYGCKNY